MTEGFSGGCACGRVRYQATAAPLLAWKCHCRDCQHATGSAFAPMVYVPDTAFTSVGEVTAYTVRVTDGRTVTRMFCPTCGAPVLLTASCWPGIMGVWAGSLDDPGAFRPQAAAWVSSAQPWDVLSPGVRQFAQGPEASFLAACHMPGGPT